jgi:ornithine carbamoyltransferase
MEDRTLSGANMVGNNLVSLLDANSEEVQKILEVGIDVKSNPGQYATYLENKTLFMYFEKPSLRTRITFEAGMTQMGGHAIYYSANEGKIGVRESVEDVARNLGRWVDCVMCRTFSHDLVQNLAEFCQVPVINGLTDRLHPCQALADYMTMLEVFDSGINGRKLAYVGDGNNVAHSLMHGGARLGVNVTVITPEGYEPQDEIVAASRRVGEETGATIEVTNDLAGVEGADAVYTDVWASMGQEDEAAEKARIFQPYQVNEALMKRAGADAIFMHCLPAHRGEEVTAAVADSPRSVIFQQAENRLHAQKALIILLIGED